MTEPPGRPVAAEAGLALVSVGLAAAAVVTRDVLPISLGTGSAALALFALATVIYCVRRPFTLFAVTVLSSLLLRTLTHITGVGALDNLDDALVLATVVVTMTRWLALRMPLHWSSAFTWASVFVAAGVVGAALRDVPATIILSGAWLAAKGLLFAFFSAQLDWTEDRLRQVARWGYRIGLGVLVAGLVNLAFPDRWAAVFSVTGTSILRFGVPSLIGPFIHPFDMAMVCTVLAVGCLTYVSVVDPSRRHLLLVGGLAAVSTVLTFRRKEIIGLALAILPSARGRTRTTAVVLLSLMFPLVILIGLPAIKEASRSAYADYVVNADAAARTVLTRDSLRIAAEDFPLGVGFGRFASRTAATHYSPEYVERGYPRIWGLSNRDGEGTFLTDTQWPAILGETGAAGTAGFALSLLSLLLAALRLRRRSTRPFSRWMASLTVALFITFFVESLASPVFSSPPGYTLFFGCAGAALSAARLMHTERTRPPALGTTTDLGTAR